MNIVANKLKRKAAWLDWAKTTKCLNDDNVPQEKQLYQSLDEATGTMRRKFLHKRGGSSMTVAREVSLKKTKDGYILKNIPVAQLKKYQGISTRKTISLKVDNQLIGKSQIDLTKALIDLDLKKMTTGKYSFALKNTLGEELDIRD